MTLVGNLLGPITVVAVLIVLTAIHAKIVRDVQSKLFHENGYELRSAILAPMPGSAIRLDEFGNVVEGSESFRFGSRGQQD